MEKNILQLSYVYFNLYAQFIFFVIVWPISGHPIWTINIDIIFSSHCYVRYVYITPSMASSFLSISNIKFLNDASNWY
jgi:hypothetical protein